MDDYDLEDEIEEMESQDIKMHSGQKGAGDRKKTALFAIGGAAAGAILGDIFIGSEHIMYGENAVEGTSYIPSEGWVASSEAHSVTAQTQDHAHLLENLWGSPIVEDDYVLQETFTQKIHGEFPTTDIHIEEGRFTEEYMDSRVDELFSDANWVTYSAGEPLPSGALAGGLAGGGSGYAADRIKSKIDAKNKIQKED